VSYWLRDKPEGDVTLTFMDAKGKQIRQFKSAPPEPKEKEEKSLTPEQRRSEELKKSKEPKVAKEAGLNRFAWNMRHPDAARVEDDPTWESAEATLAGPVSAPGQYRVRLEVGGERHEAAFEIRKDPRVSATQADLDAQFALRMRIRDKLTEVHEAINGIRALRTQVEGWEKSGARSRRPTCRPSTSSSVAQVYRRSVRCARRSAKLGRSCGGRRRTRGDDEREPHGPARCRPRGRLVRFAAARRQHRDGQRSHRGDRRERRDRPGGRGCDRCGRGGDRAGPGRLSQPSDHAGWQPLDRSWRRSAVGVAAGRARERQASRPGRRFVGP